MIAHTDIIYFLGFTIKTGRNFIKQLESFLKFHQEFFFRPLDGE